jgi:TatD DNase family protein
MFDGRYNGSRKHDPDRQQVLEKAWQVGMQKIIITIGTIFDCEPVFKIVEKDERLYSTVGCHPTRCGEFLVDTNYFEKLDQYIIDNKKKVVAIGEIGLDFDRLHFCEADIQKK